MSKIALCSLLIILSAVLLPAQTNVLTWHNDNSRDGLNSTETVLNQSNVNPTHFGKVCSAVFDGQLYAQPLVVVQGGKNIVYVVTMNDSIYSVDGTSCKQISRVSLLQAGERPPLCQDVGGSKCSNIKPIVGIVGTPVIDTSTNTIYLVSESESTVGGCATQLTPSCFTHRLHALDLTSFAEKFGGPIVVAASFQGATFTSRNHIQRAGLLLLPGNPPSGQNTLYVAFTAMDGTGIPGKSVPHGWLFGFNASDLTSAPLVWSSTPAGEGGGMWMAGAGLAAGLDAPGGSTYIYVATGDGDFTANTGGSDYGDSFVKLTPNLTVAPNGYFTPFSQACLNPEDMDFGSGGVMLFPDKGSTFYAVAQGKDGYLYVQDRANPGGYTPPTNNTCPATGSNANQEYFLGRTGHPYFTTAAYWNSRLFYAPMFAPVIRYRVSLASPPVCTPSPICQNQTTATTARFQYGTNLSISSSGNTTGTAILWAVKGNGWPSADTPNTAVLYAFDAEHTASSHAIPELWDSNRCPERDQPGYGSHFAVPTVANGLVYLGTMDPTDPANVRGELDVFGPTMKACD